MLDSDKIDMFFKEIAIKQEDFYSIQEQTWRQSTFDEMLVLTLAASIAESYEEGAGGFSLNGFRGLCNTVRFLYDLNNTRFDGENYWFSPDKSILAQFKKGGIK